MGPCSVSYGRPKALKKKKPVATEEKRITTPQKKMTVTWRPAGMALSRSGKTGRRTRREPEENIENVEESLTCRTGVRQNQDLDPPEKRPGLPPSPHCLTLCPPNSP